MSNLLIYLTISIISGFVSMLASNNIYIGISIFIIFILYFVIYFNRDTKKKISRIKKFHEMYNFINTYVITLSIKNSIVAALESATLNISKEFKEELESISHLNEEEKIEYLKGYFDFDIYYLFLNVNHLYLEQGGDVLDMFSHVLKEARNIEDYISKSSSLGKRKIGEVSILWMFSLSILIFIRFALKEFYIGLSKSLFFPLSIFAIFIFFLGSIEVSRRNILSLNVKGVDL